MARNSIAALKYEQQKANRLAYHVICSLGWLGSSAVSIELIRLRESFLNAVLSVPHDFIARDFSMGMDTVGTMQQPKPIGSGADINDLVMSDLLARKQAGTKKYGTALKANNGRSALVDAYQECLDLCLYLRQAIEEKNAT